MARFLWTRGLWLIVLEWTLVRLAMCFSFNYSFTVLSVLWALGWSMIALAALIYLPLRLLVGLCIATILLHNLADGVLASSFGSAAWVWTVLHQPGAFRIGNMTIVPGYSLIPWIAVMAGGYCFGSVFLLEPSRRQQVLVTTGLGLTACFLLLRAVNTYGDPVAWSSQRSPLFTVLSFLNCRKYPPSLDFLLMTLGPAVIAMGYLERVRVSPANPLLIFGKTPLFYFLVHIYLAHGAAVVLASLRYGWAGFSLTPIPSMGGPAFPPGYGFDLWVCYAVWLVLLVLLYPLCRWFVGVKRRRHEWWLSYL